MCVQVPLSAVLAEYGTWLANERGLVAATICNHLRWARRWLEWLDADGGSLGVSAAEQVGRFVAETAGGCVSVGTAKTMVVSLRVFLGCAFARGWTGADLRGAVPRVACWRGAPIAKTLPAGVVDLLVGCHDVATAQGLRDRAVVLLLARLGLRRVEVARLGLGDLDWRAGTVTVTGKGAARDRLPLPGEVAEALAAYVMRARPDGLGDAVFFTVLPPIKPITPAAVSGLVRAAANRCGLDPVGPHRLRHTLASQMLRAGAGLEAIGQVLRHKDISSTSVYAKIDMARLVRLAPPWPEGLAGWEAER
jgi:site-specific recombinase XerD